MKRFFDSSENRLIYCQQPATPDFWDKNWESQLPSRDELERGESTTWSSITGEFLQPQDGCILEGGCGMGTHVAAIQRMGYTVVGVDYAEQTVMKVKSLAPQLDIRTGDVRQLPFPDASLAGYWSLGVIEHFWDGYDEIIREAERVLQSGGYFFLVFPHMCGLRQWKSRLRIISPWNRSQPADFYQFSLDSDRVLARCLQLGFELIEKRPVLHRQGFEEEMPQMAAYMQKLYHRQFGLVGRVYRRLLHQFAVFLQARSSYSMLLILRRKQQEST